MLRLKLLKKAAHHGGIPTEIKDGNHPKTSGIEQNIQHVGHVKFWVPTTFFFFLVGQKSNLLPLKIQRADGHGKSGDFGAPSWGQDVAES